MQYFTNPSGIGVHDDHVLLFTFLCWDMSFDITFTLGSQAPHEVALISNQGIQIDSTAFIHREHRLPYKHCWYKTNMLEPVWNEQLCHTMIGD